LYTWDLEEGIEFCLAMQARETEEASKKVAKRALGGAAQGARTARKASEVEAQRGLGGAALRVQEPPQIIDSYGITSTPAIVLKTMPGMNVFGDAIFDGKKLRETQGLMSVADMANVYLFDDPNVASRWSKNTNQVNKEIAPSLVYVDCGHPSVSFFFGMMV